MLLDIVTHCWRYSRLLRYQLSSLVLYPPSQISVRILVYCAPEEEDCDTRGVIQYFASRMPEPRVSLQAKVLPTNQLFRRSIGRNQAALSTTADWVWFADCDMIFGRSALDSLAEHLHRSTADLVYPRTVLIQRTHALGDAAIESVRFDSGVIQIKTEEFVPTSYRCAIGGVQIVRGDKAKAIGYCPQRRYQRPADCWQRAKEDVVFRRQLGSRGVPIDVPNVFRLRHSDCGRNNPNLAL